LSLFIQGEEGIDDGSHRAQADRQMHGTFLVHVAMKKLSHQLHECTLFPAHAGWNLQAESLPPSLLENG